VSTARESALRGVALAGVVAALAAGLLLASGRAGEPGISDTPVYQRYGERIAAGGVPYRDFRVEYPPGALPAFAIPALATSTPSGYDAVFAGLMVACLATLAALVVVSLRFLVASPLRLGGALTSLVAGAMLLGPFTLTRFDLLPAAITAGAVAAVLAGRGRLGGAALGAAIATKLYPAVLLPLLVARAWRRHGRAEALRVLGIALGVVALAYVPFVLLSPAGSARSVWQQAGRPLQIESLGSAVLLAFHHAFAMPLDWASGHGSQNLTGTVAAVASTVTTIAGAAALAWIWAAFARGEVGDERFVRFAAAAAVAFVAFGKVLSPQFLVWLLPLVPLVAGIRGMVASALLVPACALTRLWFPGNYWALVKQFDEQSSWLVLARDLVLVVLFFLLVSPGGSGSSESSTATARAPARSPSRAPSPGRT